MLFSEVWRVSMYIYVLCRSLHEFLTFFLNLYACNDLHDYSQTIYMKELLLKAYMEIIYFKLMYI